MTRETTNHLVTSRSDEATSVSSNLCEDLCTVGASVSRPCSLSLKAYTTSRDFENSLEVPLFFPWSTKRDPKPRSF